MAQASFDFGKSGYQASCASCHGVTAKGDGRSSTVIGPHGSCEMPVWGYIYRSEDTQPADLHARNRTSSLLDYLARIQVR